MQLLRLFQIVVLLLAVVWWGYGSAECPHHHFLSKHVCQGKVIKPLKVLDIDQDLFKVIFKTNKETLVISRFRNGRENNRFQNEKQD